MKCDDSCQNENGHFRHKFAKSKSAHSVWKILLITSNMTRFARPFLGLPTACASRRIASLAYQLASLAFDSLRSSAVRLIIGVTERDVVYFSPYNGLLIVF